MNKEEIFSRHELFMGKAKLNKIRNSTILVAGLGGLGCVVSDLLVRLGVGKLILVDTKKVDVPDLNRQQLYTSEDIGKNKVTAAVVRLSQIHSYTEFIPVVEDAKAAEKLAQLIKKYQVTGIADCLDNYESRFALEKHIKSQLFLVHGGVKRDYGQVTTVLEAGRLAALYSGEEDYNKIIPVSPVIVTAIGSIMTHEILNNIFGRPELVNELLILELNGFRLSKISVNIKGVPRDSLN